MENLNPHLPAQALLNVEAVGRLGVLEVDTSKGRLQRAHGADHLIRVPNIELDIENVVDRQNA